jgi:multidrug efflux pump subunit AcrA (membrane-fusion protein)
MEPGMEEDRFDIEERRRRRVGAAASVVALLALIVCGVVMYPRLRSLLQPAAELKQAQPQDTTDVAVTRGPLTQALLLGGVVEPQRTARLSLAAGSGPVAMVYVEPGMAVEEGQPLLELDEAVLQRTLATVRGDLLEARVELDELLEDRGLTKRIELEEELRKANRSLDQARRELDLFNKGKGTPEESRAKAVSALAAAQEALTDLREGQQYRDALESQRITADLAEIEHGPYAWIQNPSEEDRDREWLLRITMFNTREVYNQALLQHDMDIRAAEQKVVLAKRELQKISDQILAGSAAIELTKRQAAAQQAEARVQQLQDQLKAIEEGTLDPDVAKAQALVVKLEGRAADAEASLQEAKLAAPFAGTVGEVLVAPGTTVVPGAVLLTLYSAADLRVAAQVNEMDVGLLAQGQEVELTFDAFPGESEPGTLGEIPRYGTYQNGLTFFKVAVAFDPGELQPYIGMSATVRVPLARKEDVLLIPTMAVQRDVEGYFVLVVKGEKATQRRIKTGISDGIQTEVVEGLEEGEIVRVALQYPIGPIYR